jgi:hypothetical protein
MNNKDPKVFGEFNTMDASGNNITPASNKINSFGGAFETILTADQAAEYSYEKMFSENATKQWDPAALAKQAPAATSITLDGTTLSWQSQLLGQSWAVFKDGKLMTITSANSYTVDDTQAMYAVRAINNMGGMGEATELPVYATVTLSKKGYATFYDSQRSYELPEGVKAYIVTAATANALTYEELNSAITAGVAVMLKSDNNTGGDIKLKSVSYASAYYIPVNLLKGSDEATTTTADEDSWFYKLSFGPSSTELAKTFGWFYGAADGAAFQIEGHRAWLAIPKGSQSAPAFGYILDGEATGISQIENGELRIENVYDLQGRKVANPTKGLYIVNGKKVIIK